MKFRITYEDNYKDTKTLVLDAANHFEAEKFSKNLGKVINIECLDKVPDSGLFPFMTSEIGDSDYEYDSDMG